MREWHGHLPTDLWWDLTNYKKLAAKNIKKYAQKIHMVYFLLIFISLIFNLQATSFKHKYLLRYVDGSPILKHIAQGHPFARILDFVVFLIVT